MLHFLAECFITLGQVLFAALVICLIAVVIFFMIPDMVNPQDKDDE